MDLKNQFQLLPGTKKRLGIKVPGENRFLYIGSAILGAVLVASIALTRYENGLLANIQSLSEQIEAVDRKRNLKSEENLKMLKQQIEIISGLLNDHTYWTTGLYKLSSLVKDEVQFDSLSYTGDNKIIIKAFATNYSIIAKQVASFVNDDSIIDLDLGKITPSVDGRLEFNLVLTFDTQKFIKKTSNP
jgi:Tfp pilus assembly protein PilN